MSPESQLVGEADVQALDLFDSHCHLDSSDFEDDLPQVLARGCVAGVRAVLVPATDLASSRRVVGMLGDAVPLEVPARFGAVGIHPHSASEGLDAAGGTSGAMDEVRSLASRPGVVALGETGLDYHYDFSPREAQQAVLRAHVRLALELDLPLVLHCREAEDDLLRILDEAGEGRARGVVHCYTGTPRTAEALLERGFHLGFTGVLTFKRSDELRGIAKRTPPSRIVIETDAPYLAPPPYRGKRNEPAWVKAVALEVARLHDMAPERAAAVTFNNTVRCFALPMAPVPET